MSKILSILRPNTTYYSEDTKRQSFMKKKYKIILRKIYFGVVIFSGFFFCKPRPMINIFFRIFENGYHVFLLFITSTLWNSRNSYVGSSLGHLILPRTGTRYAFYKNSRFYRKKWRRTYLPLVVFLWFTSYFS